MKIIIDTREKNAWQFSIPSEVGTLKTGDYSIAGLENIIAVERKSLDDLCNCLAGDRKRFVKELERSRSFDYFGLIIEANFLTIRKGQFKSLIKSRSVVGSLFTFEHRYGIRVHFAGSWTNGAEICQEIFEKYIYEKRKQLEAIKK